MKGSHKQFAHYLASEYNDDFLEPFDNDHSSSHFNKLSKSLKTPNNPSNNIIKSSPKPQSVLKKKPNEYPLKLQMIRQFANQLGQDAQDCIDCFQTLEFVQDSMFLEALDPIYTKFETIPVLLCSVVPREAVYLWQVNKLCPVERGTNHMVVDSKGLGSQIDYTTSLLLLAKVKAEKDELIISGHLLGDNRLVVTSKKGDDQFIVRVYNTKDFSFTARVNPFNQEILANDLYFSKVIMQNIENSETGAYNLEVTLWKRNPSKSWNSPDEKDTLTQRKVCERLAAPIKIFSTDCFDVNRTTNDVMVIVVRNMATIIAWKDGELFASSYSNKGEIHTRIVDTSLFLFQKEEVESKFYFGDFPTVITNSGASYFDADVQQVVKEHKHQATVREILKKGFLGTYGDTAVLSYKYTVYDRSVKVINPHFLIEKKTEVEQDEKADENLNLNLRKKVTKMKKQILSITIKS